MVFMHALPVFAALLGLALGSFGNVLIARIKTGESIGGRSHCPKCKKTLQWFELVPVVSFLLLNGKCRSCKKPISPQYPLVELGSAFLMLAALRLHPQDLVTALLTGLLLITLLISAVFDAKFQKLPDVLTVAIAIFAFCISLKTGMLLTGLYGALTSFVWFGGQWLVSRGKAVGSGDIFLSSALGLWLGLRATIAALIMSYMLGSVIVLVFIGFHRINWKQQRIAFGPFLATGAFLAAIGMHEFYLRAIGL
jgi:prepilin signal peptidase PulO-like enzyme (type II secretory pathway)